MSKLGFLVRWLRKGNDDLGGSAVLSLFQAGVNGKTWRLLRNWYEGGCGHVKLDGRLLPCTVKRFRLL